MQTHDLGRIFVHPILLKKDSPRVHTAYTHEIEAPYRVSKSWVFRIWGERGFVLGFWRNQQLSEQEALLKAMGGHVEPVLDNEGHILEAFEIGQEGTCEPHRAIRSPGTTWDTGTVPSGA